MLDTDFDGDDDTLFVRYLSGSIEIEARFILDGGSGGSGSSQLTEQVTVRNVGNEKQNFHLFQYSDFEMGAEQLDVELVLTNLNENRVFDGATTTVADTAINVVPQRYEGGFFPTILDKLNDGVPNNLTNTPAVGTTIGPEDVTSAYQWDFMLAPGDSYQIGVDKVISAAPPEPIVPEPTTLTLAMVGLAGAFGLIRRRRA